LRRSDPQHLALGIAQRLDLPLKRQVGEIGTDSVQARVQYCHRRKSYHGGNFAALATMRSASRSRNREPPTVR
jgi:hypothetical protein